MADGQWALLAPLLPAAGSTGGRGGRPEKRDRRLVLDAIFYLVRSGIAWRALSADFPPHQTVYALFCRWTRARAWCRIYAALRERARLADGRGPVPTEAARLTAPAHADRAARLRAEVTVLLRFLDGPGTA
jgi:transposase